MIPDKINNNKLSLADAELVLSPSRRVSRTRARPPGATKLATTDGMPRQMSTSAPTGANSGPLHPTCTICWESCT
ncbi:hypothetical protein CEXT_227692 [Caerostris extrusa]|uniref:Uncharacterized protein n=1 Tax=Caerostris extrusa TaxID=172846 RepID=A0AAV4QI34_CAEEX|nr:hypothetical protein CEXT_227692 [Caerostris extrusa]